RPAHAAELLARVLEPEARGRERAERARGADAQGHARGFERPGRIVERVAALERSLVEESPGEGAREAGEAQAAPACTPLLRVLLAQGGVRDQELGAAEAREGRGIPFECCEPVFEAEAGAAHRQHAGAAADREEAGPRGPGLIDPGVGRRSGDERRERRDDERTARRAHHGTRTPMTLGNAASARIRAPYTPGPAPRPA